MGCEVYVECRQRRLSCWCASLQPLQPLSTTTPQRPPSEPKEAKDQPLGSTWKNSGGLNIDIDNLSLASGKSRQIGPAMNQMLSNPASPVNQPRPAGAWQHQAYPANPSFFPAFK